MNFTEKLLTHLSTFGVGKFEEINDLLRKEFPANENDEYCKFSNDAFKVTSCLASLYKKNLIEYRIEGYFGSRSNGQNHGYNDVKIYAAITKKGTESLN